MTFENSNNIPTFKFALREDLRTEKQFLPTKAEPKATGWDVRAAFPDRKSLVIKPFEKVAIPLGFRGFCPNGWWYEIKPRSSTFAKKSLHALYGTIDETYEGELVFACQYIPSFNFIYQTYHYPQTTYSGDGEQVGIIDKSIYQTLTLNFGDAIGQIIPIKRQEMRVMEISNEDYNESSEYRDAVRKEGGFGSTDPK